MIIQVRDASLRTCYHAARGLLKEYRLRYLLTLRRYSWPAFGKGE
jgi:hypothetical protein